MIEEKANNVNVLDQKVPGIHDYDQLRIEIWKLSAEKFLTEDILIQRLLRKVGQFFNVDRASFLCLDENKKEYYTKLQWYQPDVGSTLGVTIPYNMARLFFGKEYVEIPQELLPGVKPLAHETLAHHPFVSDLIIPYGDVQNPSGLFAFSDCKKKRSWDEQAKSIIFEIANIVAIRSDQIKNDRMLKEREERFRLLFEQSNDAVFIHDLQGKIMDANSRACEMLGYSREELKKIPISALHPHTETETSRRALKETGAKGHTRFESRFKRADGTLVDVEISARMIDQKNRVVQGVARDITERNQAFEILRKAKQEAEAANLAKSEFLANMTHELRTPISGTIGMLDLALDTVLNSNQREYLEMAKYSITILMSLVNDILDFGKIETGNLVLQSTPFTLATLLETTFNSLILAAKSKGLVMKKEMASDVPAPLTGDPQRLQQIILKLVGNAVKFTKTGQILLKIIRSEEPEDLFFIKNNPEKIILHFMVKDTGIGFPIDKLDLIFNAFTQVDGSFTRKYGGLGLGLSITQELVRMMGGRIWAESELEKGSTFHFTACFDRVHLLKSEI